MEADSVPAQVPLTRHRAMLNPAAAALLVRSRDEGRIRVPIVARRRPHRLRFGPDHLERAVTLELLAIAAVDQPPVGPGLGDDCKEAAHAARARPAPTEATASGPSSRARPASCACSTETARI